MNGGNSLVRRNSHPVASLCTVHCFRSSVRFEGSIKIQLDLFGCSFSIWAICLLANSIFEDPQRTFESFDSKGIVCLQNFCKKAKEFHKQKNLAEESQTTTV